MNNSKKTNAYYEQLIRDYYALDYDELEEEFSDDYADDEEEVY